MIFAVQTTLLRWVIVFFGMTVMISACGDSPVPEISPTSTPTIAPTKTPTLVPSPTPTPVPIARIDEADRAYFIGDWDSAIDIYRNIQDSASEPSEKIEASLGLAKSLISANRISDAESVLAALLDQYPLNPTSARAYFLLGGILDLQERYIEAAWAYEQYALQKPGLLAGYELELQGDAYRNAEDPTAAIDAYSAALEVASREEALNLRVKIARSRAASGDYAAALGEYTSIYEATDNGYVRAQMDLLMGKAYAWLGQDENAYARYLDAVENYPLSYDSYSGLVALVEAGVPVDDLDRGLVDYFAGQYGVALEAFDRYLRSAPEDHEGTVHEYKALARRVQGDYLGAIEEWDMLIETHPGDRFWEDAWEKKAITQWAYLDDYAGALETYLSFVENQPSSPKAAEMLYDAAQVAERFGDLEFAAQLWSRVGQEYPGDELAFQALFLTGITQYRLENYAAALTFFENSLSTSVQAEDRAASYLWIGKAKEKLEDMEGRDAAWQAATLADPNGYYSLRAAELREGRAPFQSRGVPDFNYDIGSERAQAETWMREVFVLSDEGALWEMNPDLAADPRMLRGEELWALGRYGEAKDIFEDIRSERLEDPLATYQLMHHFLDLGLYQPAIYSARQILRLAGIDNANIQAAPVYLSRIRFGPYFGELILPAAVDRGLDGLFLLSVARQESLFESFATSYADARGVLQIIPTTGLEISGREGWPPDYSSDDLYRPIVSVRLGSRYLADQRDLFDGDLYAALSAYNAGPGNTLAWIKLAPDDPDLFLEILRLEQPKNYIRSIFWAFTQYNDLYAGGA
jgi:soluble lytic murein transglycosylase